MAHPREAALMRDWDDFKAAQRHRDTAQLLALVNDHGYTPSGMRTMVAAYVDFLNETGADTRTSDLTMARIEWFEDQEKVIAFVRMRRRDVNVTGHGAAGQGTSGSVTQIAFSTDRGTHWKFNVQDCIAEKDLINFSPAYAGSPALGR